LEDENLSLKGREFQTTTAAKMGNMAKPQDILPHRGIVVGEIVKSMLKQTFTWEGAARRRDRPDLENFYYEVIYALLQTPIEHAAKATKLKELKANITRLHHEEQRSRHLNNSTVTD
jgi:hypothetical protein